MEMIFHIGMGKTGTSSIQNALAISEENLERAQVKYLGRNFKIHDENLFGKKNFSDFVSTSNDKKDILADKIYDYMSNENEQHGFNRFIVSNEALSGNLKAMRPLIDALLARGVTVKIIAYVRNPYDWLPSAYIQWAVRHKQVRGPILNYAEIAPKLVRRYNSILQWGDVYREIFDLRSYDATPDVVEDFSNAAEIDLARPKTRRLPRGEPAEVIYRAAFNGMFEGPVKKTYFDKLFFKDGSSVKSIEEYISDTLDYSNTEAAVYGNERIFNKLKKDFDLDLLGIKGYQKRVPVENDEVRRRLLDYVLNTTVIQRKKIEEIERRLQALEKKLS